MQKIKCDENYFDVIDNPRKAYFLGLMYADGSISHTLSKNRLKHVMCITLQEDDKSILELFRKELKRDRSLILIKNKNLEYNRKNQYCLSVQSEQLHYSLEKHGCVERKSLILKFPTTVPEEFMSHFIRGYFDGDGCIWNGKRKTMWVKDKTKKAGGRYRIIHNVKFHFTGCIDFISSLRNYLHEKIDLPLTKLNTTHSRPDQSDRVVMLEYSGRKSVKKFYDYIYKDCEECYIPRKKEKFEEIICALSEKSLSEMGLTAGTPEMVISSQAVNNTEGSSTIPEMEVESSDSKCPTLSE